MDRFLACNKAAGVYREITVEWKIYAYPFSLALAIDTVGIPKDKLFRADKRVEVKCNCGYAALFVERDSDIVRDVS